ncbi:interleukin-6 receptor subunit beta isoform X2 [Denticeps clupeoides]|uniref:interleukin-6 receptor subunit beta isoform X2 n=1 Tax=Denticeps clupeoides TaxID=299321 RepID=UPI0010A37BE8|nr:interleukin-6 receptor subunit beta-like isoform X2 [Denticeps clupeoides]
MTVTKGKGDCYYYCFFIVAWLVPDIPSASDCQNMPSCENCSSFPGGVDDLDCFIKTKWMCTWKHENRVKTSKYKLVLTQLSKTKISRCLQFKNISETFFKGNYLISKLHTSACLFNEDGDRRSCTMFQSPSSQMTRCGPPDVSFIRTSGQLHIKTNLNGPEFDHYTVSYSEHNVPSWKTVLCKLVQQCTIDNLTQSLSYDVKIQCVTTKGCFQCAPSETFRIPQELSIAPKILQQKDELQNGTRKLTLYWQPPSSADVENYKVNVGKASNEINHTFITSRKDTQIILILSSSAYNVSIYASNDVSNSTSTHVAIPALENVGRNGQLNVEFTDSHTFNLLWSAGLENLYECYCVEWFFRGENLTSYRSFSSNSNKKTIRLIREPHFKPYKRYTFLLHVRPDKDTCNLKQINNSESTYGRKEAYFEEGTPLSAPRNLSSSNVTEKSFIVTWIPVPEKDLRGFLQGYTLHYADNSNKKTETNINIGPDMCSYELLNLTRGRVYRVQITAFTAKGAGKRSMPAYVETASGSSVVGGGVITGPVVVVTVLLLAFHLCFGQLKRAKTVLWPNIPNPGKSSAIQKIEGAFERDILKAISSEKMEVCEDSRTLYITENTKEKEEPAAPDACAEKPEQECLELLPNSDSDVDACIHSSSADTLKLQLTACKGTDVSGSTAQAPTSTAFVTASNANVSCSRIDSTMPCTASQRPVLPVVSDYTTMELYQQNTVDVQPGCPPSQTTYSGWPFFPQGNDYVCQSHLT